jgi:hypothetical protein
MIRHQIKANLKRANAQGVKLGLGPPDMLLRAVPIGDDRLQLGSVGGAQFDLGSFAHPPESRDRVPLWGGPGHLISLCNAGFMAKSLCDDAIVQHFWRTSSCPFSELRLQLINPSMSPNELNPPLTPHSIIHGDACFASHGK